MCLGGAPPTPAEAREMDTRGLAAKLSDLKDENARLQQQVRLAALDGRGLHSLTSQLILSRFGHTSLCPPV